jgi:hypothetical protein
VTVTRSNAEISRMLGHIFHLFTLYNNHMCAIDMPGNQCVFFCSRDADNQYGLALWTPVHSNIGFNTPLDHHPGAQPADPQMDEYLKWYARDDENDTISFFPIGPAYTTVLKPEQDAIQTVVFSSSKRAPIEFYFCGERFILKSHNDNIEKVDKDPEHTFTCMLFSK